MFVARDEEDSMTSSRFRKWTFPQSTPLSHRLMHFPFLPLQSQIEKKMSTIDNVIEMLTNIIGVDAPPGVDPEDAGDGGEKKKRAKRDGKKRNKRSDDENSDHVSSNDDDSEPEKLKTKVIESMKQRSKAKEEVNV